MVRSGSGLRDRYCIVGVGETVYSRWSGRTTLSMACEAIVTAAADAGIAVDEIDGLASHQATAGDSCGNAEVASALGIRTNMGVDILGGGNSIGQLVAQSIALIDAGYCETVAISRSMNGRSGLRMGGGSAVRSGEAPRPQPVAAAGRGQFQIPFGIRGAPTIYAFEAMSYLQRYGYNTLHMAELAVTQRFAATLNPKATRQEAISIDDHQNSRWIAKPFRLLDCCQENDVAGALIVTSAERAADLAQPPVYIMGGCARASSYNPSWTWGRPDITEGWGKFVRERSFTSAGIGPEDVDIVTMYDNFTTTPMMYLEALGFCGEGEGGDFVGGGRIHLDGELPQNTNGGQLSEGYAHGIGYLIETTRQLRGRTDDACEGWRRGEHSYDRARGCRQTLTREERRRRARGETVEHPSPPSVAFSAGGGGAQQGWTVVLRR